MKSDSVGLWAFVLPAGEVVNEVTSMCADAEDHCEALLRKVENLVRRYPYLDGPITDDKSSDEVISPASIEEVLSPVFSKKLKQSRDANGLRSYMFKFPDPTHWNLLLDLVNRSLVSVQIPDAWKNTRMLLLPEKELTRSPEETRSISFPDSFQKRGGGGALFLSRFRHVLHQKERLTGRKPIWFPGVISVTDALSSFPGGPF